MPFLSSPSEPAVRTNAVSHCGVAVLSVRLTGVHFLCIYDDVSLTPLTHLSICLARYTAEFVDTKS